MYRKLNISIDFDRSFAVDNEIIALHFSIVSTRLDLAALVVVMLTISPESNWFRNSETADVREDRGTVLFVEVREPLLLYSFPEISLDSCLNYR